MPHLLIIRGLPGSGKTLLAKRLAKESGAVHCESDQYFMRDGQYMFDATKLGDAHKDCLWRVTDALDGGLDAIVSNTFTRQWEMQPYIDYCINRKYDYTIIKAEGRFQNVHNVPEEALQRMKERWEDA